MAAAKALYEEAFPENERIPWASLLKNTESVDFAGYYDQDRFVGFTYCYKQPEAVWWFYFAVRPDLRGLGYGTAMIEQVKAAYGNQLLMMDIEDPDEVVCDNRTQRTKRRDFYLRMGFCNTPAGKDFDGVRMIILSRGGTVSQQLYELMLEKMWKEYFGEVIDKR